MQEPALAKNCAISRTGSRQGLRAHRRVDCGFGGGVVVLYIGKIAAERVRTPCTAGPGIMIVGRDAAHDPLQVDHSADLALDGVAVAVRPGRQLPLVHLIAIGHDEGRRGRSVTDHYLVHALVFVLASKLSDRYVSCLARSQGENSNECDQRPKRAP